MVIIDRPRYYVRLSCFFFQGAAYYALRQRVALSTRVFGALLALLLLASCQRAAFHTLYPLVIAYLILYLAYVPSGFFCAYNGLGDYSYGVYIYAFPIQQALIALVPTISVLQLMAASGALTLALACVSWHMLEKRALGFKEQVVRMSRRSISAA
jgi:peptidoglycan/LPS O-acetylase OafA/YrhL